MVLPEFEAASLPPLAPEVQVTTWGESDNPARLVANLIASASGAQPGGTNCTIGVSDRMWSVFLLQIQAELPRELNTFPESVSYRPTKRLRSRQYGVSCLLAATPD